MVTFVECFAIVLITNHFLSIHNISREERKIPSLLGLQLNSLLFDKFSVIMLQVHLFLYSS